MPRIIGVDVPDKKRLEIALTYIHGLGSFQATKLIRKLGLNPDMRSRELTEDDVSRINALLTEEFTVEGDLRRQTQNNIKRLISIHSYRGLRHRTGLPVRGQGTQKNARTRKGKKKTVAGKKK